jgi:Fe-S oxidoreductase
MGDIETILRTIPDTEISTIESSCCGMAGAFGYQTETEEISLKMGELSLFPAVRNVSPDTLIAADGTSCRHQIHDGTGTRALHVARILQLALPKK